MHLDVSRHFFSVREVKRYIDIMELHKMNILHWHLTDDQGWRVEIRKYPLLTEKGAFRKGTCIGDDLYSDDGIPYGGFYTQDEIREVVSYAAERGISVMSEIDMPGHMLAALASYPWLGCTGGPYEVWGRWGISDDVLAIECVEEIGSVLGQAIAGPINIFNPELVVIGGRLAIAKDYLMLPIKSAINRHSLIIVSKDTSIKFSKLGKKGGPIGACMLSRSRLLGLL